MRFRILQVTTMRDGCGPDSELRMDQAHARTKDIGSFLDPGFLELEQVLDDIGHEVALAGGLFGRHVLELRRCPPEKRKLAITISGGGAAGAYSAGLLEVLLDRLHKRGIKGWPARWHFFRGSERIRRVSRRTRNGQPAVQVRSDSQAALREHRRFRVVVSCARRQGVKVGRRTPFVDRASHVSAFPLELAATLADLGIHCRDNPDSAELAIAVGPDRRRGRD